MDDLHYPNPTVKDDSDIQQRTSELIIEIMNGLMYEGDYEPAMMNVLATFGKAIHADRLYILEIRQRLDSGFIEWCKEGVAPRLAALKQVSDAALDHFVQQFRGRDVIFAGNLNELTSDARSQGYFARMGITSVFSLPLRQNGRAVGVLGADNYELSPDIDFMRLVRSVGPCMATAISNQQLLEELEWSGTHDMLTGLLNRRGSDLLCKRRIEGRPQLPFAVGLIDIDNFKTINDRFGHAAGDEALRNIAHALTKEFPPDTLVSRNGGDEMLVVLFGDDVAQADELFTRFASFPLGFDADGQHVAVTVSIGYASIPTKLPH